MSGGGSAQESSFAVTGGGGKEKGHGVFAAGKKEGRGKRKDERGKAP